MIWADRIALVWAAFVAFVYFLMCRSEAGTDPLFFQAVPYVELWVAVPVWLFLRGVDWIASGRLRRGS